MAFQVKTIRFQRRANMESLYTHHITQFKKHTFHKWGPVLQILTQATGPLGTLVDGSCHGTRTFAGKTILMAVDRLEAPSREP